MTRQTVNVDPAVIAALGSRPAQVSRRTRNRRRRAAAAGRATLTLELNRDVVRLIQAVAEREELSPASLVNVMAKVFFEAYAAGEIDLGAYVQMSRSPRYLWKSAVTFEKLQHLAKGDGSK